MLCYTFGCIQLEHNYCYCLSQNRNYLSFHSSHYFIMMCRKNIIPFYLLTFNQTVIKKIQSRMRVLEKMNFDFHDFTSFLFFVSNSVITLPLLVEKESVVCMVNQKAWLIASLMNYINQEQDLIIKNKMSLLTQRGSSKKYMYLLICFIMWKAIEKALVFRFQVHFQ